MTDGSIWMMWVTAGVLVILWTRDRKRLSEKLKELSVEQSQTRRQLIEFVEETGKVMQQFSRLLSRESTKDLLKASRDGGAPESRYVGLEKRHLVLSLAQKGHSTKEIAERLMLPSGEVSLILSLDKSNRTRMSA